VKIISAKVIYQAMLFFNSTLLYSFAVRSTGSRDLLFFSAILAALSLVANLAVQLSDSQFQSGIWVLKIASIGLLIWVSLRTGITPSVVAVVLGIAAILVTHRNALVGAPSRWTMVAAGGPIVCTAILTVLVWGQWIEISDRYILLLLILPYLLTALVSTRLPLVDSPVSGERGRIQAWTLIASQLLPTASSFVMLTLLSHENDVKIVANFVMMERAIAIGGSLIYFYARAKGLVRSMTNATVAGLLLVLSTIFVAAMFDVSGPLIAVAYLASGSLLSYGTISLGAQYAGGIFAINGIALVAVVIASFPILKLHAGDVLAVYICPQLLLMAGLVIFGSRKHA
jgi:hypothetical protein